MRSALRGLAAAAGLCLMTAAPAAANPFSWTPDVQIGTTGSPFGASSVGAPCQQAPDQTGTDYPGTQVEPWLASNPSDSRNQIAFWQQDRFSNGGAVGLIQAYTRDDGQSWTQPAPVPAPAPTAGQPQFDNCTGGTGDTGGYTRTSDPWVDFSAPYGPAGAQHSDAWTMALQADIGRVSSNKNGMSVARSRDGGATWETPINLRVDTSFNVLNDKNSLTGDRFVADDVYAIWDRLEFPNANAARQAGEHAIGYRGPTWFSRTTNGTSAHPTWEKARIIYDPGEINQTIGNQIVQTGTGTLVDGFNLIYNRKNAHKVRGYNIAVLRSTDRGSTWSNAKIVTKLVPGTVPGTRTGDIIPEITADPRAGSNVVYLVWQDGSTGTSRIMLARSTDGGVSWPKIEPVSTGTTPAFTPNVNVDPDGTLTLTYYQFQTAGGFQTDSWSRHSHDLGDSFGAREHVNGPFDMSQAAEARGFFVGDYEGLDSGEQGGESPLFSSARVESGKTSPTPSSETYGNRAQDTGPAAP